MNRTLRWDPKKWLRVNRWQSRSSMLTDVVLLEQHIDRARIDWDQAHQNYNFAIGEKWIDHSIYTIECAEKKYMFLLKQARKLQEKERAL